MPAAVPTQPPVVLLTIDHAGKVWRVSSRPLEVVDDGTSLLYRGGLAPMDVSSSAPLTGIAKPQSQAVECVIPGDFAELTAQDHLSSEITAEIATIDIPATTTTKPQWGDREVKLSGSVEVKSDGYQGRPLRLEVTADDPADHPGVYPTPNMQINDDTFGGALRAYDANAEGENYPQVYGKAGLIWAGQAPADVPASPGYVVAVDNTLLEWGVPGFPGFQAQQSDPSLWGSYRLYLLIAGHWVWPDLVGPPSLPSARYAVKVWDTEGNSEYAHLFFTKDALGRIVALAGKYNGTGFGGFSGTAWTAIGYDSVSGTYLGPQEGQTYYVTFAGGSAYNRNFTGPMLGAGEIIRHALSWSNVRVDWRRTAAALPALDRYELAGFWDGSCDPWAWLVDNVLPWLPCSWVPGPHGVYPVMWRLDATHYDADVVLTDGLNCTIEGQTTYGESRLSRHVLDYANGLIAGKWRRRATWHGEPTRQTTRESTSLHLRRAQLRYGSQIGNTYSANETVESSDFHYTDGSADLSLGWLSRYRSQPERRLTITSDGLRHRARAAFIKPGMAISITSDRWSLDNRIAYAEQAGRKGGLCYANLVILSAP